MTVHSLGAMLATDRHLVGADAPDRTAAIDPWALLDALPDPVVLMRGDGTLEWGNAAALDWWGGPADELRGRPVTDVVHPDDAATVAVSLVSVQAKAVGSVIEARLRTRAGTYHRFEVRGRAALEVVGVDGMVCCLRDVTDRRRWEVAAGDEHVLRAIIDNAPAITMLLDGDGVIRGVSRALTTILGCDVERALGVCLDDLADPADADIVARGLRAAAASAGSISFEANFARCDGRGPVPLSVTVSNLLDDVAVAGLVVSAVDITPLAEARARLAHLASHDPLTGLPNRALLVDRLEHALAVARRRGTSVTVVYCDIDRFKAVNDRHGHRAGDWVLVELGRRLQLVSRESDTVARIGGDEFAIVVEDEDDSAAVSLAMRIDAAMVDRFVLPDGRAIRVAVSVGAGDVASAVGVEEALAVADVAMYDAKRSRRSPWSDRVPG